MDVFMVFCISVDHCGHRVWSTATHSWTLGEGNVQGL